MSTGRFAQPGLVTVIIASVLAVSGCSGGGETDQAGTEQEPVVEAPSSQAEPAPPAAPAEDATASAEESEPGADPVAEPTSEPDSEPVSAPSGDAMTSAEEPATAPATDTPTPPTDPSPTPVPVADTATDAPAAAPPAEGELVTVADTKPGLTRIGVTKCKMCHKVQHASWAESAHAERTPPVDCESCHGSGSEYWKKSIMEDPELARAAGLVTPDATFCQRCHIDDWRDDMMERAHAHEEDAG